MTPFLKIATYLLGAFFLLFNFNLSVSEDTIALHTDSFESGSDFLFLPESNGGIYAYTEFGQSGQAQISVLGEKTASSVKLPSWAGVSLSRPSFFIDRINLSYLIQFPIIYFKLTSYSIAFPFCSFW